MNCSFQKQYYGIHSVTRRYEDVNKKVIYVFQCAILHALKVKSFPVFTFLSPFAGRNKISDAFCFIEKRKQLWSATDAVPFSAFPSLFSSDSSCVPTLKWFSPCRTQVLITIRLEAIVVVYHWSLKISHNWNIFVMIHRWYTNHSKSNHCLYRLHFASFSHGSRPLNRKSWRARSEVNALINTLYFYIKRTTYIG